MGKDILKIIDRIKEIEDLGSDTEVAEALDVSRTALYNHKTRNSIPYETLSTYCDQSKVSLDWLLTGKGPKLREEKEPLHINEGSGVEYKETEPELAEMFESVRAILKSGDPAKLAILRSTLDLADPIKYEQKLAAAKERFEKLKKERDLLLKQHKKA